MIEGDLLYGRGSGDAKASVAAMLFALADLAERKLAGRALGLFTYGEETRDSTMPAAVAAAGRIDAALIGEPTNLQLAVAQRGLMMVDLVCTGDQRHAGYAGDGASAAGTGQRELCTWPARQIGYLTDHDPNPAAAPT